MATAPPAAASRRRNPALRSPRPGVSAHTASQPVITNARPSAYPGRPNPEDQERGGVLRLTAVEGVRLERHIYLMLPSVGATSPAARRFADQLLRIHPVGS
jgi:hypothetical protein